MHFHFRARFLALLVLAVFLFFRSELTGLALQPLFEKQLTGAFGVPVTISHLRIDLLTGNVSAEEFTIANPPGFTKRPHFKARVKAKMALGLLLRRKVKIEMLEIHKTYFLLERQHIGNDEVLNIKEWIHHMEGPDTGKPEETSSPSWEVRIDRGVIDDMAFLYENRDSKQIYKRYVFQHLSGELKNFHYPPEDRRQLTQPVSVRGYIGLTDPAPVWVKGMANFASSKISFNLDGKIEDGALTEYRHFFEGLPVKVIGGTYDLTAHAVCDENNLKWDNDLLMKDLRMRYKRTPAALIWGLPIKASVAFLESQQTIPLKVPVYGDISDPDYSPAFRKAFQEALTRYTQTGMSALRTVAKSGEVVAEVPMKVVGGTLGKVTELVAKTAGVEKAEARPQEGREEEAAGDNQEEESQHA